MTEPGYAELCALSHFSFQRGASSPEELVQRAHALGYAALALTDACSLAGVVRAHVAAKACGLHLIIGAEWRVHDPSRRAGGFTLLLLATDRAAYGLLSEAISAARATPATRPCSPIDELPCTTDADTLAGWARQGRLDGLLAIAWPWREPVAAPEMADDIGALCRWLQEQAPGRAWLGVQMPGRLDDRDWLQALQQAGTAHGLPCVAVGAVLMHQRSRKPLQDVMTAIRLGRPVAQCGYALQANAEAHLHTRAELARRFPPALLAQTLAVAQRCRFSLSELRYEYPQEILPDGETPQAYLQRLTRDGARERYPSGVPDTVAAQLQHELALIADLGYERYFLTVHDVVRHARSLGILCQGRGSAANSAVCYCLGITEVDPARASVLFERFISRERNEPPDIDVDFEHERREEVIQYLYRKYGRARAALTAVAISYRPRSAIRDVGKALGLPADRIDALARTQQWWDGREIHTERLREAGIDASDRRIGLLLALTRELIGMPRHLSQHPGGFVLTRERLTSTVPVVPAAMPGRTVIEWDKDDIDALGLLKVDVLALGMLSALRRALDLLGSWRGQPMRLQDIPPEDPETYEMVCRADTVGVFQIESRAQMSMLPRLQPRAFYDLVVEVAIVRPGPIQGGMVHPYLQRREALRRGEPIDMPSEALRPALERTLGVPIFQEQVMQLAIIAAGFTPGEADGLRRAMAAWRRKGGVDRFHARVVEGMVARGYARDFAEAIFRQIEGFGEYGFPESHAASFALLVYASAWIKRHHPACFLAALLNAQPMGFYAPSQLVQDARRHGVCVRPVDVRYSHWDCTIEPVDGVQAGGAPPAVRLGLRLVAGLTQAGAQRLLQARAQAPLHDVQDLAHRAALDAGDLHALAAADALQGLAGHRREQVWAVTALQRPPPVLHGAPVHEDAWALPAAPEGEEVVLDHAALGLTLRSHPLALLRTQLSQRRCLRSDDLRDRPDGATVRTCGLVITRQRPATAKGVVFVTLEDEAGCVQVIVWKALRERQRPVLLGARLLAVQGRWQRQGEVCHLVAQRLEDLTPLLGDLPVASRDFR